MFPREGQGPPKETLPEEEGVEPAPKSQVRPRQAAREGGKPAPGLPAQAFPVSRCELRRNLRGRPRGGGDAARKTRGVREEGEHHLAPARRGRGVAGLPRHARLQGSKCWQACNFRGPAGHFAGVCRLWDHSPEAIVGPDPPLPALRVHHRPGHEFFSGNLEAGHGSGPDTRGARAATPACWGKCGRGNGNSNRISVHLFAMRFCREGPKVFLCPPAQVSPWTRGMPTCTSTRHTPSPSPKR